MGNRLATAGLNTAYGLTEYPTKGPHYTDVTFNTDSGYLAVIQYDQNFVFNPTGGNSSFYICVQPNYDDCDTTSPLSWQMVRTVLCQKCFFTNHEKNLLKVEVDMVEQTGPSELSVSMSADVTGIAYLWNESPVLVPLQAPIYSTDRFQLPAAPWKAPVTWQ